MWKAFHIVQGWRLGIYLAVVLFGWTGLALAGRPGVDAAGERRSLKPKTRPLDGPTVTPRIVGGDPTSDGDWPWMVALVEGYYDLSDQPFCGGSLIHPSWVLTAAHCLQGMLPHTVDVGTGVNDINEPALERLEVAEIIMHPAYDPITLDNDLALLRLARPSVHPDVRTIRLIDHESLAAPGVMATTMGWGSITGEGNTPSEVLNEVDVPLVSLTVANGTNAYDGTLTTNMIAAGYALGLKDACAGDSGGPLIVPDGRTNGTYVLAGIVSFGKEGAACGDPDAYGVYTRVHRYRNFILGHLFPDYAAFELQYSLASEWDDMEPDGLNNWHEFAVGGVPTVADPEVRPQAQVIVGPTNYPGLLMRQRADEGEVEYAVFYSDGVGGATTNLVEGGFEVARSNLTTEIQAVEMRGPQALSDTDFGLFEVVARPGVQFVPSVIHPPVAPGYVYVLGSGDEGASNRYVKGFSLSHLQGLTNVQLSARSMDFDTVLEVVVASNLVAVATDGANSGGGTDDRIIFTPLPGETYLARVTSVMTNATGVFTLTSHMGVSSNTAVTNNQTVGSALDASDAFDPLFPGDFYYEVYDLDIPLGEEAQIELVSENFDTYLYILEPESGAILAQNDDGMLVGGVLQTDSRLRFQRTTHSPYHVVVSSSFELETGSYTLTLSNTARPMATLASHAAGTLATSDPLDPLFTEGFGLGNDQYHYYDDVDLSGFAVGDSIRVTVTAPPGGIDTYIYLMDPLSGQVLQENDDAGPPNSSEISFTVKKNARYALRVSSYNEEEVGPYTVSLTLD